MASREYDFLYLATDGAYFKIGVTNNIKKRKPEPVRHDRKTKRRLQVEIVRWWLRPGRSKELETYIKSAFCDRCVYPKMFEWFDVTEQQIMREIERALRVTDAYEQRKFIASRRKK